MILTIYTLFLYKLIYCVHTGCTCMVLTCIYLIYVHVWCLLQNRVVIVMKIRNGFVDCNRVMIALVERRYVSFDNDNMQGMHVH